MLPHGMNDITVEVRAGAKLGGLPVGLLIDFHVAHLRHDIKRMVN